jgi:hypothetical protein
MSASEVMDMDAVLLDAQLGAGNDSIQLLSHQRSRVHRDC